MYIIKLYFYSYKLISKQLSVTENGSENYGNVAFKSYKNLTHS